MISILGEEFIMTIELSMIAPHVPSICHESTIPEFQQQLVDEMKKVAKQIEEIKPDAIVLVSCHWPSTFAHYVDATPNHKGILTANECPDLISDVPYEFPGDEDLANELVKAGQDANLEVVGFKDPYYVWDYGTVVPLRYLTPNSDIPVINLSVTLAASIEETYKWGQQIKKVLDETNKRIVFISSGALSHNLVRGRHNKPTVSEHAMDKQFISYVMDKDYKSAYDMLHQYARLAKVESGGRHLAMLFGILEEDCEPTFLAEGQSSGSWNTLITFEKVGKAVSHS
jgi:3,4-dihydroxyphenylacetate 2,3-dioxygenase